MQLFIASVRRFVFWSFKIVHIVQTLKHNTANLIVDAHSHFKIFSGHNWNELEPLPGQGRVPTDIMKKPMYFSVRKFDIILVLKWHN